MKITIKDIAVIAGVSHSTVSRALNDSPQISPKTKDKIKNIARSMNFEFNSGARSLSGRKTGNIGVVYEAHMDQFGASLYVDRLFVELRQALELMGLDAILLEAYHPETGESNVNRLLRQQKVDGFLIVHNQITHKDYESIIFAGLPIVQLHMKPRFFKEKSLNYFFTDHQSGGFMATSYLISRGCKKILTVRPDDKFSDEYKERTNGYIDALDKHGIKFNANFVITIECSYISGYALVTEKRELIDSIDGIFFQADIQAFGFLSAAMFKGIQIPKELKVIGYDDAPICESTNPRLTTIQQPRIELATKASKRIAELIENKNQGDIVQEVILPKLVERDSC
ncbi:MAG: LacI family transcriptional regulator [Spirochaetaceae bacterium]